MPSEVIATLATGFVGGLAALIGKAVADRWLDIDRSARTRRLDFLERQLAELFWPLYIRLEKDNVLWTRILEKRRLDDSRSRLGDEIEKSVVLPNHADAVALITSKIHLLGDDDGLRDLLISYVRHVAVYQGLRASGEAMAFPKSVGENFPNRLFSEVEERTLRLQREYDTLIGRKKAKGGL